MVRTKTCTGIAKSCLVSIALLLPLLSQAGTFNLGKITQAEGEITYLNFAPPHALKQVKAQEAVQTDGSYLTQDNSFMTVELFDGSWLRVSPKSKFTLEYLATSKTILVHLFSGSAKFLFSAHLNQNEVQKIMVKSADTLFESVDAKFSVVRSPLTDTNSLFVEKGTVMAIQHVFNEKKDMELVHSNETISVKDNQLDIESPRKMSEREIKFLHPSHYLKQTKTRF
jgi:ferric-dicitrate binding protein FerR (iron transport regulator)